MSALVVEDLAKRYGRTEAVAGLTFAALPGRVTGLLGANGSGKTTTLRAVFGLTRPDRGRALVEGRRYRDLSAPLSVVGACLDLSDFPVGVRARIALRALALRADLPVGRVGAVLEEVGLADDADRYPEQFSLGMRQRLRVAAALLGQPRHLVLDEPLNGLDPSGIAWMRRLVRAHAAAGGAVLVATHLLAEAQEVVDDVVVIDRGRSVCTTSLAELRGRYPTDPLDTRPVLERAYFDLVNPRE